MLRLSENAKGEIKRNWSSAPWLSVGYCLLLLKDVKNCSKSELESKGEIMKEMIQKKEVSSVDEFISVFEEKFLNT